MAANASPSRRRAVKVPSLHNGMSMQPPAVRLPNQVAYAANAVFSVIDGVSKRPGTFVKFYLGAETSPAATTSMGVAVNHRLLPIVRDPTEKYICLYSNVNNVAAIRVFTLDAGVGAEEATVSISAGSQTYLNGSGPDRLRAYSANDVTFFWNMDVATAGTDTSGSISGVSVASPTTITTGAAHGLTSGDTVIITNTSTTPTTNGTYTATVTGATTFTIPVNVSAVAVGTGTWTNAKLTASTMPQAMSRLWKATAALSGTYNSNVNTTVTITSHGLTTGQTVVVTGSTGVTSINGTRVVTVTGANTFQFNPAVDTSAGAGGNCSVIGKAGFSVDAIAWNQRQLGTSTTNPLPTPVRLGYKIRDLCIYRGRLTLAAKDRIIHSQTDDFYNLFIADPTNIVDTDPVNVQIGNDEIVEADYLVPIRKSLLVFTRGARQFEIGCSDTAAFTQSTVTCAPTTRIATIPARPAVVDPNVYFATVDASSAQLHEYPYNESAVSSTSEEVSSHVRDLMFLLDRRYDYYATIKTIAACPQSGTVFLLRTEFSSTSYSGYDIFVYTSHYLNGNKYQSAWTRYDMNPIDDPTYANFNLTYDMCVIANDLYVMRSYKIAGTQYFYIERLPVGPVSEHRVT